MDFEKENEKMGKVIAIDNKDAFNYESKGHDYDPYLKAFITGANGTCSSWEKEEHSESPLVIRGLGGGSQKAIKRCWETGRTFYAIDTGYFGNQAKHKRWHRITKNNLQHIGPIIERPLDRLDRLGYSFKPFYPGKKILICPPSDKVMNLWGQGTAEEWTKTVVEALKKITDREIEIRLKPSRRDRVTINTIQQALANDVHCLVTYNSIAATEALMEGRAALTLGPNAAQTICETNLENIDNPKIPTKEEMIAFMAHLSYAQFTYDEMQNGFAWKILQEQN